MAQASLHAGAKSEPYQNRANNTSEPYSKLASAGQSLTGVTLVSPIIPYNTQGIGQEPEYVDGILCMILDVFQDQTFETRLVCRARTYLTVGRHCVLSALVSTVDFSIFSGKPSKNSRSPDDNRMLSQWLKEWHHCSLREEPYRSSGADKEHVWAVRALYCSDGSPARPNSTTHQAGPRENDTLCYISKIVTEQAFAGKRLLSPTMDLLYRIVTHVQLAKLCPITGPVCWVLEPGFIDTPENRNMWPKLDGEEEYDYFARVTQVLLEKVYPKIGFEVCRKDFRTGDRLHTYMCRRVYAHRRVDYSASTKIEALPNKY